MEEKIKNLIEPVIKEIGLILDEVIYEKENGTNFLRVIIDKKDGYININDCVSVNDLLDPILDNQDIITDTYILDVCSKEKGDF